jgi:methylenetetrahydrofolate dehydrogenase (NADP+) / methenyltetrahydrofolate cyclohydrolase
MVINGRELALTILEDLKYRVSAMKAEHKAIPDMAVLRVGDDPSITSYINQKRKMAEAIGARIAVYEFPVESTQEALLAAVSKVVERNIFHGVIVQLPLPKHIDEETIIQSVPTHMDIDGFHKNAMYPVPIAAATLHILEYVYLENYSSEAPTFPEWLKMKNIVVVGKGKAGGKPVIESLQKLGIEPAIIDSKTENPSAVTKQADIIITAVGKRGVITKEMVKQDVILVGIGMQRGEDGKFYGDYDEEDIKDIAAFYTPIPGGVGPVNVAKLMENLVIAAENSQI